MRVTPTYKILLVEDDANDVFLVKRVFENDSLDYTIDVFNNSDQAIAFLEQKKDENDLPCLALLDIKLISGSGFDVLEHIKRDNTLHKIPTIIMSSSERQDDKKIASDLGCDAYYEKLRTYTELKIQLPLIVRSWAINTKND